MQIEIECVERRRFRKDRFRSFKCDLPTSWSDLPSEVVAQVIRQLNQSNPFLARLIVIRYALREVPEKIWNAIGPMDLSEAYNATDWVDFKSSEQIMVKDVDVADGLRLGSFHFKYPTLKKEKYHWMKPNFEDGTFLDFILCTQYYDQYFQADDEDALLKILAVLARTKVLDKDLNIKTRKKLRVADQLDGWIIPLKNLDPEYGIIALMYVDSVLKFVKETYGPLLFVQEEEESADQDEDALMEKPSSTEPLGWYGVAMNVARDGVYGTFDEVLQTPFHDVAAYLVKQALERKEHEKHMASIKGKSI